MYTIKVTDFGKQINLKYKKCTSPCTLRFKKNSDFNDCIDYLKENDIKFEAYAEKRYPMRKVDNGPTIQLNTTIGGRP